MVYLNRKIKAFVILIFVFILTFLNSKVYADSNLSITNWNTVSKLNVDGSLDVTEDITFSFKSKYNGVYRDIYLKGTSGIDNINVYQVDGGKVYQYKFVTSAKNGDSNVYEVLKNNSYSEIKIYSPSKDLEKTFRFEYKVLDVGVKYNDTGELFYNYIGVENKTEIAKLNIKLTVPGYQNITAWIHGNSSTLLIKGNDIYINSEDIKPGTNLALRAVFPKDYILSSKKYVDNNALSRIKDEEDDYAKAILRDDKKRKDLKMFSDYGAAALILLSLFLVGVTINKFKRKEKFEKDKFYDIFPEYCTPAVTRMLCLGYVTNNDVLATLLDLSRRGYIKLEKSVEKFGKKQNWSDFSIKMEKPMDEELLEHEKFLIKWLIYDIGDGKQVLLSEINKFTKEQLKKITRSFNEWKALVKEEAAYRGYYDKTGKKPGIMLILFSISEFLLGFIFIVLGSNYGLTNILISIIIFIYGIKLIYRRSDYGNIMIQRWKRFKKYYSENEASIPIDSYMAYAVALGLDKNTFEKYKIKYSDNIYSNEENFWIYWYFTMCYSSNKNSFNESMNSAFGSTTSDSSVGSSSSSVSGGGGAGGF